MQELVPQALRLDVQHLAQQLAHEPFGPGSCSSLHEPLGRVLGGLSSLREREQKRRETYTRSLEYILCADAWPLLNEWVVSSFEWLYATRTPARVAENLWALPAASSSSSSSSSSRSCGSSSPAAAAAAAEHNPPAVLAETDPALANADPSGSSSSLDPIRTSSPNQQQGRFAADGRTTAAAATAAAPAPAGPAEQSDPPGDPTPGTAAIAPQPAAAAVAAPTAPNTATTPTTQSAPTAPAAAATAAVAPSTASPAGLVGPAGKVLDGGGPAAATASTNTATAAASSSADAAHLQTHLRAMQLMFECLSLLAEVPGAAAQTGSEDLMLQMLFAPHGRRQLPRTAHITAGALQALLQGGGSSSSNSNSNCSSSSTTGGRSRLLAASARLAAQAADVVAAAVCSAAAAAAGAAAAPPAAATAVGTATSDAGTAPADAAAATSSTFCSAFNASNKNGDAGDAGAAGDAGGYLGSPAHPLAEALTLVPLCMGNAARMLKELMPMWPYHLPPEDSYAAGVAAARAAAGVAGKATGRPAAAAVPEGSGGRSGRGGRGGRGGGGGGGGGTGCGSSSTSGGSSSTTTSGKGHPFALTDVLLAEAGATGCFDQVARLVLHGAAAEGRARLLRQQQQQQQQQRMAAGSSSGRSSGVGGGSSTAATAAVAATATTSGLADVSTTRQEPAPFPPPTSAPGAATQPNDGSCSSFGSRFVECLSSALGTCAWQVRDTTFIYANIKGGGASSRGVIDIFVGGAGGGSSSSGSSSWTAAGPQPHQVLLPPMPWGTCLQMQVLSQVVATLAAAGFGGGERGVWGLPAELAAGLPILMRPASASMSPELQQYAAELLSLFQPNGATGRFSGNSNGGASSAEGELPQPHHLDPQPFKALRHDLDDQCRRAPTTAAAAAILASRATAAEEDEDDDDDDDIAIAAGSGAGSSTQAMAGCSSSWCFPVSPHAAAEVMLGVAQLAAASLLMGSGPAAASGGGSSSSGSGGSSSGSSGSSGGTSIGQPTGASPLRLRFGRGDAWELGTDALNTAKWLLLLQEPPPTCSSSGSGDCSDLMPPLPRRWWRAAGALLRRCTTAVPADGGGTGAGRGGLLRADTWARGVLDMAGTMPGE